MQFDLLFGHEIPFAPNGPNLQQVSYLQVLIQLHRYMEVIDNYYEEMCKGLRKTDDSVRGTINEGHLGEFNAVGKS